MRGEYRNLVENPIPGFEFVTETTQLENLAKTLSKKDSAYKIMGFMASFLPVHLVKPFWERFKKLPDDIDLTYAVYHPVFRKEPWILEVLADQGYLLIGNERAFDLWKWLIKGALHSDYCKKIIFQLEAAKNSFLEGTHWERLLPKIDVVYNSVPEKKFIKTFDDKKVKLLFVNSANINTSTHLQIHGGLVALEAFSILREKYNNIELVVRSGIRQDTKEKFLKQPGITIYDEVIPWEQLEKEFKSADIFIYPTNVTPANVFLDAMSYELPIVTTDVWGNPEIVADGKTGLIVHHPTAHKFTDGNIVHFESPEFKKAISSSPSGLVEATVEKLSILIENPELRRQMGKAGRREIEQGKFSKERRNEKLKEILVSAIGEGIGDEKSG
ncbi:MAG: glycosyltransferase family 4 protein [Dehalococcoidales bacterium]|nr:glycosyltransferase family 4 protein [Dehalococcoidales bacterium]